jgi:hypothetical protein
LSRKVAAVASLVVGLCLIAVPPVFSLFDRTAKAERILDRFEFLTLDDSPQRYLAEARVTRAGSVQLVDDALRGESFPALGEARRTVPKAHEFSVRYSRQLEAVDEQFESVYDVPVPWLPLTATPWLFLVGGLTCLALGLAALLTRGRAPLVALFALGLALMVGPLAFGAVGKAADGEDVKDFASRGLTSRAATAAQRASAALDGVVREVRARGLDAGLERDHPEAARFVAEWDVIGPRLNRLADSVSASIDDFEDAGEMPISLPAWLLLGGGLAVAGSAAVALVTRRV